ncbi:hypothetical protein [Nocardia farcinica]|uniref:Uncharacterized protein n=1 Tax=Nocardia farcinica (strain IFM 10152) TaxID=247156 RepID=Q5YSR1_NOCFA|nr:hypothetical protein [Nocardia farcinica]BAD58780.1 hypothetical protein NFA_39320 [Nocardia farcinica IFM 10152]
MSFADDVIEFQTRGPAPRLCKVGAWVAELDDHGRRAFDAYLSSGRPVSQLWRIAVRWGCDAAETRFRVHCRRECCCYSSQEAA